MFKCLLSQTRTLIEWRKKKVTNMDMIVSTVVLTFAMLRANDRLLVLLNANKAKQQQKKNDVYNCLVFSVFLLVHCRWLMLYLRGFIWLIWVDLSDHSNKRASESSIVVNEFGVCVCGMVTLIYLHCRCISSCSCIDLLVTNFYCEMCAHF